MGKIVAIGGGDLREKSTLKLDKFIIKFSGKDKPKALFIPTASSDSEGYYEVFGSVYKELGCETDVLMLLDDKLTKSEIEEKIAWADIVYVGGGNTAMMIDVWKKKGVDVYLKKAYEKGTVLSGLSAGAICWFGFGHSDSNKFAGEEEWNFMITRGIGIINMAFCPHYNEEGRDSFDQMLKKTELSGIASQNNTAIVIEDGSFKIIKSDPVAKIYLLKYEEGELVKTPLENEEYLPLGMLL